MKVPRTRPDAASWERIAAALERIAGVMEAMERANFAMVEPRNTSVSGGRLKRAAADNMRVRMVIKETAWRWRCTVRTVKKRVTEVGLDHKNLTKADVATIEATHPEYLNPATG